MISVDCLEDSALVIGTNFPSWPTSWGQCLVAGIYSEVRDLASASLFKVWLTSDIPMTQQVRQIQHVSCYPCATPDFSMVGAWLSQIPLFLGIGVQP